jgi:hypothetical protein
MNLKVGSEIITRSGSGRSSKNLEVVSSLDDNSSWLAKTDRVVITSEELG